MKKYFFSIIILFATLIFSACTKDDTMGISIQPQEDRIKVVVDTFMVASQDFHVDAISAQCYDSLSMLFGEYYSAKYGSTKADLIVQFAPPIDADFPYDSINKAEPDSLVMVMGYKAWDGAANEPFEVSVYELDNGTPDFDTQYFSDLDISQFASNNAPLLGSKIVSALDQTLGDSITGVAGYMHSVHFKFDDDYTQKLFKLVKDKVNNTNDFLRDFKGMYITTTYGQSTMLYLYGIEMRLFYHYKKSENGKDTVNVNNYINFPASKEVRVLNKITHQNIENVMNKRDSVNYIKSAGGIYPKLSLPIAKIMQHKRDSIGDKIFTINSAILSVEATEIDTTANKMFIPNVVMLIPETELDYFLKNNKIYFAGDSAAVYTSYNSTKKEYTFDVARLLNSIIRKEEKENTGIETFNLVMIPVDMISSNEVRPQKYIRAATIRSSRSERSPMRLELIYSGF
ncbi:MAG: DUF4270 domain-containing protein [Prevotellaceae bacterium]|jgi:hypothetical protein|nr:DUF4270 domain-containing protein [Prevotellaceae bacterium]